MERGVWQNCIKARRSGGLLSGGHCTDKTVAFKTGFPLLLWRQKLNATAVHRQKVEFGKRCDCFSVLHKT